MNQDWDIKPRADACARCSRSFTEGDPYFSALFFGSEGHTRADVCAECRPRLTAANPPPHSAWQGVFHAPLLPPPEPLKKETAETLLRRLMQGADESCRNVIFILTVMLERKRILAERVTRWRADGTRLRVYEHRRTGETFLIPDPALRLDQLEKVQAEVAAMLGGDGAPRTGNTSQQILKEAAGESGESAVGSPPSGHV